MTVFNTREWKTVNQKSLKEQNRECFRKMFGNFYVKYLLNVSENTQEKVLGNTLRNTQRKALGKYQGMSSDVLLVNASDNTYRNASFIHLFIFNLFNLTKINICKHYKQYNKSSVNYMLISINSSYKKNKRTTKSPMFNEF